MIDGKTYIVNQKISLNTRLEVQGNVSLILFDGCELTASKGIQVGSNDKLTIYAQSQGNSTGTLIAYDYYVADNTNIGDIWCGAPIGGYFESVNGNDDTIDCGTIIIHGGKITANASNVTSDGIGGCYSNGGTVKIYGGTVNAIGHGSSTAGIGGTLTLGPGVECYSDNNTNPPTTLVVTGPVDDVFDRGLYMTTTGPTLYGLTVDERIVSSANASDILGDGTQSVSYNAPYNILTLENASINGQVKWAENSPLTIEFKGINHITTSKDNAIIPSPGYKNASLIMKSVKTGSDDPTITIHSASDRIRDFASVTCANDTYLSSVYPVHYGEDGSWINRFIYHESVTSLYDIVYTSVVEYPLWVYNDSFYNQVTDANAKNVCNNGTMNTNAVSFTINNSENILILDGIRIQEGAIVSDLDNLTIKMTGAFINEIYTSNNFACIKSYNESARLKFDMSGTSSTPLSLINCIQTANLQDLSSVIEGFASVEIPATLNWFDDNNNVNTISYVEGIKKLVINNGTSDDPAHSVELAKATFPLEVDGKTVDGLNAGNVLGDGTVEFKPASSANGNVNTLTLKGASITKPVKIGLTNLTIDIQGTNTITTTETCLQKMSGADPSITFISTSQKVGSLTLRNTNSGVSEIKDDHITISKELAPILPRSGNTYGYTSNMYYFTDAIDEAKFVPSFGVKVNDMYVYAGNYTDVFKDGTVSFEQSTNTLTLNNASISSISTSLSALNIDLIGDNRMVMYSDGPVIDNPYDIKNIAVTMKSSATEKGCLSMSLNSNPNGFLDDDVTLSYSNPLSLVYGDLTTKHDAYAMISEPVNYELFVDGVMVVGANASNITKTLNSSNRPTASFDADTKTLTFDGIHFSYSSLSSDIAVKSNIDKLNVKLVGNNVIRLSSSKNVFAYTGTGTSPTLIFEKEWKDNAFGTLTLQNNISSVGDMVDKYTIFEIDKWKEGTSSTTSGWKYSETGSEVEIWYQDVFDLKVAGKTVTTRNMNDILSTKNVTFTPKNGTQGNTLTLNSATLTDGIVNGLDNLTIHLQGKNVIIGTDSQNQLEKGISSTNSAATLTFTSELDNNNAPTGKLLFPYVSKPIDGFASCTYNSGLDYTSGGAEYTPVGATQSISIFVDGVTLVTYFKVGNDVITSANCATTSITPAGESSSGTISYEASTQTLTLKDVKSTLTINSYIDQNLTIAIKGTNVINTTSDKCINGKNNTNIGFTKVDDGSSLTLTCANGNNVLSGFMNNTSPDMGAGLYWVATSQSSALVTTDSHYVFVDGVAMTNSQSINGKFGGTITYTETATEKKLTFENYDGEIYTGNAIETGVEGLIVELIGNNKIACYDNGAFAFKGLNANASIKFTKQSNGNLTMIPLGTSDAMNGFTDGKVTYSGMIYYASGTDESGNPTWTIKQPVKPSLQKTYKSTNNTDFYTYAILDYANADKSGGTVMYNALNPTLKYSFDFVDGNIQDITDKEFPADGIKMTSPGVLTAWVEVSGVKSEEVTGVRFGVTENPVKTVYDGSAQQAITLDLQPSALLTGVNIGSDGSSSFVQSFDGDKKELTVTGCGKGSISLRFSNKTAGNNTSFVSLGDTVIIAIEVVPAAPSFVYDNIILNTSEIQITSSTYDPTIFYTWDDVKIGTVYKHSADNPTLIKYDDTKRPTAQKATLKAWEGFSLGNNEYLMSAAASHEFSNIRTDISNYYVELPANAKYTGTAIVPVVKESASATSSLSENDYNVSYKKITESENDVTSMTDAGKYKIIITGQGNYGGEITVNNFQIAKAANAINTVPVAATGLVYTKNLLNLIATAGAATSGQVEYKLGDQGSYSTTAPQATDAGDYTIYYKVSASDNYEECAERSITAHIEPAEITSVTLEGNELTYNGTEQTMNVSKVIAGSLEVDDTSYDISGNKGLAAGEYTVTVTAKSGINNFKGSAQAKFTIKDRTAQITFASGQTYQTFYNANEDFLVPNGVTAYIVTGVTENQAIIQKVSYLRIGEPLLLEKTDGSTIEKDTNDDFNNNMLKYADDPVDISGKEYVLYKNEFVKASGKIPAGKCYLDLNGPAVARSLSIAHGDDEAAGINGVTLDEESGDERWYDLQGRRIEKPTKKGLYILNGKKTVINIK
ncbi:MAG: hypothetical protein IK075_09380 [Prevotella sp.]|nr:hypothetical protein [Prevotella sp.]